MAGLGSGGGVAGFQQFGTKGAGSVKQRAVQSVRECLGRDDTEGAAKAIEALLKRAKPDPEALFLAGIIAEKAKKIAAAADYARRSLAVVEHPDAQLLLARCKRTGGETDACLELCDKVLQRIPGHIPAMLIQGGALEESGRYDEAREIIKPLMEPADGTQPEAPVRFEWAKLLVQDKQYKEAVACIDGIVEDAQHEELEKVAQYLRAKACDRNEGL